MRDPQSCCGPGSASGFRATSSAWHTLADPPFDRAEAVVVAVILVVIVVPVMAVVVVPMAAEVAAMRDELDKVNGQEIAEALRATAYRGRATTAITGCRSTARLPLPLGATAGPPDRSTGTGV